MQKIAYLTIDDGPTEDFVRKVDYLKTIDVPAIFFCRGDRMEQRVSDVIYAIQQGFVIGNHSYDHPNFSELSVADCLHQIKKTDTIIEKLYKEAGIIRPWKLFRFPGGDKGSGLDAELGWSSEHRKHLQAMQDILEKLDYKQPNFENIAYRWYLDVKLHLDRDVYWTYDSKDYMVKHFREDGETQLGYGSFASILARMDEDVPEGCRGLNYLQSSDIVMLHDYPGIENIFVPLLEAFLAKGIKFILPKFAR